MFPMNLCVSKKNAVDLKPTAFFILFQNKLFYFCFDNAFKDSTLSTLGFGLFSDKFKFLDKSNITGDAMKIEE